MQGQSLLCHQKSKGLEVTLLLGILLCPLKASGYFVTEPNSAQKGPGALLKAMRRSTSFICGTRCPIPIAPNSGGLWHSNNICGS